MAGGGRGRQLRCRAASMPSVRWSDTAVSGLRRNYAYLAARDPNLTRLAAKEIRDALAHLLQFPHLGRHLAATSPDSRQWLISCGRAGFVVQYEIDGGDILITGFRHQREKSW